MDLELTPLEFQSILPLIFFFALTFLEIHVFTWNIRLPMLYRDSACVISFWFKGTNYKFFINFILPSGVSSTRILTGNSDGEKNSLIYLQGTQDFVTVRKIFELKGFGVMDSQLYFTICVFSVLAYSVWMVQEKQRHSKCWQVIFAQLLAMLTLKTKGLFSNLIALFIFILAASAASHAA